MTDIAELKRRKVPLNLAIVHTDAEAFIANLMGWLEITAFITAQRTGEAQVPSSGETPKLSPQQLRKSGVHEIGNDAIFAFCMTAAMKAEKAAVDKVESALVESMGKEFPGSVGLWHFRAQIDAPVTLDDFVGQAGKKMLLGDIPPPPMRAKENWNTGLRFFEKARKSNFVHEIMFPWAKWTRSGWTETLERGVAFLQHIEDSVPVLRTVLDDARNDEPFIANALLNLAPAVDMDVEQTASEQDRRQKIDVEDVHPGIDGCRQRCETAALDVLRREAGIVDQRVQRHSAEAFLDLGKRPRHGAVVAEIDLDVVIRPRIPWAPLAIERLTRTGDDSPTCFRKQLHGCVPDAARGPGQHHGFLLDRLLQSPR